MKIESILRITGGVLQSTPFVTNIENIQAFCSKVTRGSLFLDINHSFEDVQVAIENGAYAIISAQNHKITDTEIAWIKVDDLQLSIVKLARYYVQNKNYKFLNLTKLEFDIATKIKLHVKVKTLSNDIATALKQILSSEEDSVFLVCENDFIHKIDPTFISTSKLKEEFKSFEKSIFLSTFIYKGNYFVDLKLPFIFLDTLYLVLNVFDSLEIGYELESFNNFSHFIPQFVDDSFNKKEFGSSHKALIFEQDFNLFEQEIEFLESKLDINEFVIFTNQVCTSKAKVINYTKPSDIKKLKQYTFKYALILGNIEEFDSFLNQKTIKQLTLI